MSLIHNEKTKLTATWLNGIAIAAIAVGAIAPSIAAVTGSTNVPVALALFVFWVGIGIALHRSARAVLDGLKEEEQP